MRRIVQAALVLVLALAIALTGIILIRQHQQSDLAKWDFDRIAQYQEARRELDAEMSELQYELKMLEASVQGSVVLMFDQCTANVYDVAYAQLHEFEMEGSVVFRGKLPGDEGAITEDQWRQMQESGWSAVLGADEQLLSTLNTEGDAERLRAYAESKQQAFMQKGFRAPIVYAFSEGEYTEQNMAVLMQEGFAVFTASEAETGLQGESAVVFQEFYISSDPNAPLLQASIEAIKNTADVRVIKTRYVMDIEDIEKDVMLDKFRGGMLTALAVYRRSECLRIESAEKALANYQSEIDKLKEVNRQRDEILKSIDAVQKELNRIWNIYRS